MESSFVHRYRGGVHGADFCAPFFGLSILREILREISPMV